MVAAQYNRLVHDVTGWRGAFPLIIPIEVGDYFELRERWRARHARQRTELARLGSGACRP
jgi:hypothetical protein